MKEKMKTKAVCPRVWNGLDCQCEPLCHCGKGEHDSIHDASKVKDLHGVHKFNPPILVKLSLPTSDTPRTDQWIERYNLMRGTGLEAFPMDLEYELKAKDAIISDMGKRFDKLGDDLAAITATAEDYRKQACTPGNCRREDLLRQATAIRDELIRKVKLALLDAISVFSGKGQTVTAERIEAWQAAVKFLDDYADQTRK